MPGENNRQLKMNRSIKERAMNKIEKMDKWD